MFKNRLLLIGVSTMFSAFSADCVWTGLGNGWSDAANWVDGKVPVAGDTVQVVGETDKITVGDDDIELASSLAKIQLDGASSELVIDVTEDANLGCMVQGAGTIVKKGSGSVILTSEVIKTVDLSSNKVYAYNGTTHYTCSSEEGSLIPTACIEVPVETETVE